VVLFILFSSGGTAWTSVTRLLLVSMLLIVKINSRAFNSKKKDLAQISIFLPFLVAKSDPPEKLSWTNNSLSGPNWNGILNWIFKNINLI